MSFDEAQLSTDISRDAESTSRRKVNVVQFGSGYEVRNEKWRDSLRAYDISYGIRDIADVQTIREFWEARGGRARGFRFKDWSDYQATAESLAPDGSPTVQLTKTYSSSGQSYIRDIKKPVSGSVTFQRNGGSYSAASIDTTTGIVTLAKDKNLAISSVTAASPAEATTSSNHGLNGGDTVYITNTGLPEIDNQTWTVTIVDPDTVKLDGSDTTGTGGSSNGSLEVYVQPGETLTWSGEYDVPVRFQDNQIPVSVRQFDLAEIPAIPLVEIKL